MPLTFLAHQAPLLPVARRWPRHVDGVALLVGTMAPDYAYVLDGTRWHVWAHALPALATFCIPATLVVAWCVVRVLAPIVPDHLPEGGAFRWRDYRALARHRIGLAAPVSAFAGSVSHVVLDEFNHAWGWPAQHWPAYTAVLFDGEVLGRSFTVYRCVGFAEHVLLSVLCLVLLWRYGRERWLATEAAEVPAFVPSARTHAALWGCTLAAVVLVAIVMPWQVRHSSALILRLAAGAFGGLVAGALLARRLAPR